MKFQVMFPSILQRNRPTMTVRQVAIPPSSTGMTRERQRRERCVSAKKRMTASPAPRSSGYPYWEVLQFCKMSTCPKIQSSNVSTVANGFRKCQTMITEFLGYSLVYKRWMNGGSAGGRNGNWGWNRLGNRQDLKWEIVINIDQN